MTRKLEFGGKGNGLVWLSQNTDLGFSVPEFQVIDDSFYEDVLKQREAAKLVAILQTRATGQQHTGQVIRVPRKLEERCNQLANQFQGRGVAVRSSAVGSEDSDKHSGAGIYETFFLEPEELTPTSLKEAVLKVYGSVNSERAVQYRQEAGLGEERMAVVVQERADLTINDFNGVTMSRLPSRKGIIPVSWSNITGAVIQGKEDVAKYSVFFTPRDDGKSFKIIFSSEGTNTLYSQSEIIEDKFVPLLDKLKARYGRDFELEFVLNLPDDDKLLSIEDMEAFNPNIRLVQIRPLTNVQDKEVKFPNKKPIFTAELCMGVGEYIGPWATTRGSKNIVKKFWDEPSHYAFITPRLEKTVQESLSNLSFLFGNKNQNYALDYDEATPNKRAIVLTHQATPGMHALTVANEKGILCVARNGKARMSNAEFEREHGYSKATLMKYMGGTTLLDAPELDVPLEEVGEYVHVVSDGLRGHVYRATEQEAREFAKGISSQVDYHLSPLEASPFGEKMFDIQFTATPTNLSVCTALCRDFVRHMEKVSGRRYRTNVSPAGNCFDMNCGGAEFEVYYAMFSPDNKEEGITFSTGRSSDEIADMPTTKKWFEDFRAKLVKGYTPSGE